MHESQRKARAHQISTQLNHAPSVTRKEGDNPAAAIFAVGGNPVVHCASNELGPALRLFSCLVTAKKHGGALTFQKKISEI
jgi:hypothetical protein